MRASGGARNNVLEGVGIPPHGASSLLALLFADSSADPAVPSARFCFFEGEEGLVSSARFSPIRGEEGAWGFRTAASSRECLTSSARIVRARTISNARKPRISIVSSERSSYWDGRLR